ncbi:hypothetical protein DFQ01_1129 [Paenibacillus cellulosilyticus]|uniref:DNA-binding response regulator n=1 Tax=Paenibacillus cellulosilyticus TaxID=375489 RepID=A0A2V2YS17_9BACL|nr:hypothetical protein [Paenibacillus cellulosilyticus]PWW00656.1 hypothetical protein DFQ01_1129 [Paenibacillus cellulosilyticus]QKS45522.1 DNA-binding response regulator [Paenibacillus cellulosilyticus]
MIDISLGADAAFEKEYMKWLEKHQEGRTGEQLRRITNGHGYGEKLFLTQVWWPIVHSLDYLHPEFVVADDGDKERFIDLAYIRSPYRIAIEIDGYGPHLKNIDRYQFGDNLMRHNHLVLDGWKLIRFSVTDIEQRPERCIRFVRSMLGQWYGQNQEIESITNRERQIIAYALYRNTPIRAMDIANEFNIRRESAGALFRSLHQKGLLTPISPGRRIHYYVVSLQAARLLKL